ncbi:MAG: GNAT family N-acetyltransferase [Haliscomenobacter sp.]|nr:GNAT family N-acetyltransferase [Haliscomenobacter sp.]
MWDKDSADLIGYVAFHPIDWSLPKAAITGFIDKNRQGKGYMPEVLQSLFPFAFQQAGLEKLTLLVSTENTAAQRLARKCGFQREGDLREEIRRKSGEPLDLLLFGLTKSTYQKV